MRNRAIPTLITVLLVTPVPAFAFIDVERSPFSLSGDDGSTISWEESYLITVDDMQVRVVTGAAGHAPAGEGLTTLEWDPEIISVTVDGDELVRRTGFGGFSGSDPLLHLPFIGIGGPVSPSNPVLGIEPAGAPPAELAWLENGEEGYVAWSVTYQYQPGDAIHWLSRTYVLNATLSVECQYGLASEYRAISQLVRVTNGEVAQSLPFPLEAAFCLGSQLGGRGIALPEMNLDPDRYHIYPGESLPEEWYNESSGGYELPAKMWDEETLPGMLFLEFDLPEERDWFGVATESDLRYELLSGVGVRIVETDGFEGIRPYVVLVSGPGDHVIFGIKPFETPGPYDDFDPVMLDPGEGAAVELLWGFPEDDNQTMSVDVLERFISDAPTALEFHASRRSAEELFANANALAALGEIGAALEKAQESAEIYRELGRLSSAMFEEGRKVNVTMQTWITSTADAEPKFDRLGRPALVYGTLAVALLIALVGAWIYIIEPRLRE